MQLALSMIKRTSGFVKNQVSKMLHLRYKVEIQAIGDDMLCSYLNDKMNM